MNINKKYQGGGINKKRMGDHSQMLVNPEPLIPEVGNKGDTPLVKRYQDGGEVQSGAGQKKDELKKQIMNLQMRLQQIEDQMQSLSGRQGIGGSMYQILVDQRREIIDQIKVLNASRRDAGGSLFMEHGGKMKYDEGGKSKETFSGHIYNSLEEANEALKDGSYKKNASKDERRDNKYVINFKGDDGKIHKKTFRPYNDGGMMNVKYGHGGKTTMAFLQDGGKPEFDEEPKEEMHWEERFRNDAVDDYMQRELGITPEEIEMMKGENTEEAGTPTKNLTTKRPDGEKWLGDTPPPTYGASEEHVPFLITVYEMMDAGEDMDQMYHSQKYLRPYIKYIMAGQNETVLPSLENAEGSKNKDEKEESKLPAFLQNMSKDDIMNVLKESFGGVRQMKE